MVLILQDFSLLSDKEKEEKKGGGREGRELKIKLWSVAFMKIKVKVNRKVRSIQKINIQIKLQSFELVTQPL